MAVANIVCIKWGTLFGPEYVNRLYSGVRRNLDADIRFLCMTENSAGFPREWGSYYYQVTGVWNRQSAE